MGFDEEVTKKITATLGPWEEVADPTSLLDLIPKECASLFARGNDPRLTTTEFIDSCKNWRHAWGRTVDPTLGGYQELRSHLRRTIPQRQ